MLLLISRFTDGYFYGILGTISSLILFNWYFTAPYLSLKVNDPTYSITFIIMSITAVITSASTTKIKKAAEQAKEKEAESNALYKMTNLLTDAEDTKSITSVTVKTVSKVLSCDAAMICYKEDGTLEKTFVQQKGNEQIRRKTESGSELKNKMEKLHTPYDIDSEYFNYPIYGRTMILGILRIPKDTGALLNEKQNRTLYAIIESTALALERLNSIKAQVKSHEEAVQEHYRGNLLRAISHDIRTPLSGIMGSGEMLMDMTDKSDPRFEIAIGVLILMMVIGGGIGSTAGGIKISRVYLLLRIAAINIRKKISPNSSVKSFHYNKADAKEPIDTKLKEDTTGYFLCYMIIYVAGSLLITVTADCTLTEAMFDFASALSTVGLSIGITNPTTNNPTLIIEMIGMLMGRLEIFIVLIGITFGFTSIKNFFKKTVKF